MDIGKWVLEARKSAKLTQEELGEGLCRSKGNISSWENGAHEPSMSQVLQISRVTKYPLPLDFFRHSAPLTGFLRVDIQNKKGRFLLTELDLSILAFAIIIEDKSMEPEFEVGSIVIVNPDIVPRPGDCIAAKLSDKTIFRKYRESELGVRELMPLNDDWSPIFSNESEFEILGTMVEHRRYRKK